MMVTTSPPPILPLYLPELITACITPFQSSALQPIDTVALEAQLKRLVQAGSDGLLINGTTAETPALTLAEKIQQIQCGVAVAKAHSTPVHVMAGISGNATQKVVDEIQQTLAQVQPDSLLVVVPYYNKPSQAGMLAHFSACVAAAGTTPIVIYNIPGRTGVSMNAETMAELHERFPTQILGVKQSAPDMDTVSHIRGLLPTTFHIWCGDDSLTLPMLSLGAVGTISVLGNVASAPLRQMIQQFKVGELASALALHRSLFPLIQGLFKLTNPIIVKAVLAQQGVIAGEMRLPMLPPSPVESMTFVAPLVEALATLPVVETDLLPVDALSTFSAVTTVRAAG
jgi:4-hydroxy-tetrahydrodipicolinate synthase